MYHLRSRAPPRKAGLFGGPAPPSGRQGLRKEVGEGKIGSLERSPFPHSPPSASPLKSGSLPASHFCLFIPY